MCHTIVLLASPHTRTHLPPRQVYNTDMALQALRAHGLTLANLPVSRGAVTLTPEDLVDGDRERTLALLWVLALQLQLPPLLQLSTMRAELVRLLASARRKAGARAGAGEPRVLLRSGVQPCGCTTPSACSSCPAHPPPAHNHRRSFCAGATGGVPGGRAHQPAHGVGAGGVPAPQCGGPQLHQLLCRRARAMPAGERRRHRRQGRLQC